MLVFYLFYISNATKIKNLTHDFSGKRGVLLINFFFCKGFSERKKFQKTFFFKVFPPPLFQKRINYTKLYEKLYEIIQNYTFFFYTKLYEIIQNYTKLYIFIQIV